MVSVTIEAEDPAAQKGAFGVRAHLRCPHRPIPADAADNGALLTAGLLCPRDRNILPGFVKDGWEIKNSTGELQLLLSLLNTKHWKYHHLFIYSLETLVGHLPTAPSLHCWPWKLQVKDSEQKYSQASKD